MRFRRAQPRLGAAKPQAIVGAVPVLCCLLVGCGERAADPAAPEVAPRVERGATPAGPPLFAEVAAEVGLNFVRFDGRTPDEHGVIAGGRRMFEWVGGGLAAADYDADGRPDLYFTQGRDWGDGPDPDRWRNAPPDSAPDPSATHRDRLFRNLSGKRFADVTDAAGLLSTGYGAGAAAGDYNGDGFPDLFVCNAGANRLLRNNGDGTFSDVTDECGLSPNPDGTGWTTSAAVADLNADGLPDLYETNYLTGPGVFTTICRSGDDPPRVCNPDGFAAAPDRLWLNLGTGRFAEVSEQAGLAGADPTGAGSPAGPGLGVLVADLDGRAGNEIFVANDQRPNHFYTRVPADGGESRGTPRFAETARVAGAATGGAGAAEDEACMGVACGDADGDGRPDLFVTNFADQSNTLYVRADAGRGAESDGPVFYDDATRRANLWTTGYDTLGFGTAFLDADRDGAEDLIFVNGHLDDFSHNGTAFFMRPALLKNTGGGRFEPVPPAAAGAFFDRPALGRGLARLDWDGDGREEAAVTHLNGPAALLRNTGTGGAGVTLRLVGTADARDAVGATATVTAPTADDAPAGPRVGWVTAGDGYLCGDEKRLAFGLGATPLGTPLAVSVRWPNGAAEAFAGVTAGGRFLLVQGRGEALAEPGR